MTANPYLSGNFGPVEEETTAFDLPVQGEIPEALNGRFLRIGPNPLEADPATHHWFVGSGLVHALRLDEGNALWYRSRFVRDESVCQVKGFPAVPAPEGRGEESAGAVNTNVIGHAGKTFAVVEAGGLPVELTEELETVCRSDFDGTLPLGFTAHPKVDPDTGEMHATTYSPFDENVYYVVVGTDGKVRRKVPVHLPHKPMIHDCAITENYFLVLDLPAIFDAQVMLDGYQLPYRWHPEQAARVGLLPREGDASDIIWCEVDSCYVFHPMNAYEDADGRVVLDVVRHPAMFASDFRGPNEGAPRLERWLLDPKGGPTKVDLLHDGPQEFPRHDERLIGKAYRYGYSAGLNHGFQATCLYKHDLKGETTVHYQGEHRSFFEPVFVPKSDDAGEDEGWVLAYVHDAERNAADVIVLDAQDFGGAPLATIQLPIRVPYGFHGNWVPQA